MKTATVRRQQGVTLVEASTVVAIVCLLVGAVAPSFDQARQRRHLEGAAAQLETDLQYSRSLAVARNSSVRVGFNNGAACYVIHTGAAGACHCSADGSATCTSGAEALRTVAFDAGSRLALQANSSSILFDAVKGTVSPTVSVQINAANGRSIRNVVNIMGRIRACSPNGLPGYAVC